MTTMLTNSTDRSSIGSTKTISSSDDDKEKKKKNGCCCCCMICSIPYYNNNNTILVQNDDDTTTKAAITKTNISTKKKIDTLKTTDTSKTTTGDTDAIPTTNRNIPLVYSPTCHHVFCVPCISRVLFVPGYYQRTKKGSMTSGRVITMTQGECPKCRTELSYFDLKKITTTTMDDTNSDGTIDHIIQSNDDFVVEKVLPPVLPKPLLGTKFTTKAKSYIQFPMSTTNSQQSCSSTGNSTSCCPLLRYVTISLSSTEEGKCKLPMKQYLGDTKVQITSWQFLDLTHTFHGRMKKVMQENPEVTVEFTIWMTFSDDYQFMVHGVCRLTVTKRFYIEVVGESYPQSKTTVQSFVHPFGMTEDSRFCRPQHIHPKLHNPRVLYDRRSFWGNTYIQKNKIGLVSYHFERKSNFEGEEDNAAVAYISFHHPMSGTLTPLDNGQPVPSRVRFRNIVCPDMYTFRASICWYDDYHTTWNGIKQWDYDIHFDSQWLCIQSGSVRSIPLQGDGASKTSVLGKDLIYINAAAYDLFIDTHMIHELHYPSPPGGMELALMNVLSQTLARLYDENVSDATVDDFARMTVVGSNRFMENFDGQKPHTIPADSYPQDNVQFYHF